MNCRKPQKRRESEGKKATNFMPHSQESMAERVYENGTREKEERRLALSSLFTIARDRIN